MRKTLMIILLLVFVLPFSTYIVNAAKDSPKHQKQLLDNQTSMALIRKNQKRWKSLTAHTDVIHSDEFGNRATSTGTTLDQVKNHSQAMIQGTVYNLQKMNSPKNMAYTKATIHVDRVLSGDESLKNKTIYVAFDGGLVPYDRWYANMNHTKRQDHEILVKNDEFMLPKIGAKVITGVIPNHLDEPLEHNESLKQSGFTIKNSYALESPQYNFWVKQPDAKKFILNNPKISRKQNRHNDLAKQLQALTNEINQKYNQKK